MWALYLIATLTGLSAYGGIRLARARWLTSEGRARLTAVALGIVLFVIWDVLSDSQGLIAAGAGGSLAGTLGLEGLFAAGAMAGFGALLAAERIATRPSRTGSPAPFSSGTTPRPLARAGGVTAVQLPVVVAAGLGVHGLFEGFAVGTALATGVLTLALVLVVGMCLHKVGEGVCICGCSLANAGRYSSTQLLGLGLLAGGPISLGVLTGNFVASVGWISLVSFGAAIGVMAYVSLRLGREVLADRARWAQSLGGATLGFLVVFATSLLVGLGSG